ncbi:MAG TPA: toprim domain-containing protein, partial [Phototrophicaceae bacterium]|nr:toprim domain-containing protein [Phototrophicaceae bacterium]
MVDTTQTYCMKCRTSRDMVNPTPVYMSNGRPATSGTCSVCGTRLFRVGLTPAHEGLPKPEAVTSTSSASKSKAKTRTAAKKSKSSSKTGSKTSGGKKKAAGASKSTPARSARAGKSKLVIVESPAKARTVGRFLGDGYVVKASRGHVRDLLVTQLSVDVQNDFEPKYRVPNDKRDTVKELAKAVENAGEIYLATDPDREGEAIAWHLMAATEMDATRAKRVVFHEITDAAVKHAFEHPRPVDMNLVNAQQARRILDRIVGYNITELLWDR